MKVCSVAGCTGEGRIKKGFCNKHYHKIRSYGDPLAGKENKHKHGEGYIDSNGYRVISINNKKRLIHRLVVEKVIGRPLKKGECVHHINDNKDNNENSNLVLCPSRAYHNLLHRKEKALKACGHASWRKCQHCKKYDNPKNLSINSRYKYSRVYHRKCANDYNQNLINQKKGQANV